MASNILTIYDELAATTITLDGVDIAVKDADELPNVVHSAQCPVRLLTPLFEFGGGAEDFSSAENIWQAASGSSPKYIDWVLYDLLLWDPIARNVGIRAYGKMLVDYCKEYYEMLTTLSLTGVVRVDPVCTPVIIDYPLGSGNFFAGARAILRIREKWN